MPVDREFGDIVDIGGRQVGRDFQEYRRQPRAPSLLRSLLHPVDQRAQLLRILQRAQARRVGAGNVDRQIGRERGYGARHHRIIADPVA